MTDQHGSPKHISDVMNQILASLLEEMARERMVVVLEMDKDQHINGYSIQPLSEITAELHMYGFSKALGV